MKKISRRLLSVLLIIAMLIPTGMMGITSTAENTTFNDGDIIEFGSYPQSQITDEKLIETLTSIDSQWKSYGYYSGDGKGNAIAGDWMQYKDITLDGEKYRAVKIINNKPNYITDVTPTTASHQLSNGFVAGEIYWFKYEPIKWIVLDSESGYVMSLYAIDAQPFTNDIQNGNNYSLSTLRKWLNEDFYYTAFTSTQNNLIEKNYRDNSAIKSDFDSEATYDKVTLLSYTEAKNYGYNRGRVKTTDYASSQGAPRHGGFKGCSDWWLRTAGSSGRVACCMIDIYIRTFFDDVTFTCEGIRPCININFNAKSEMQTPAGYNFYEDSFSFGNYSDKSLSKKYFTGLFSSANVEEIFRSHKNAGGLCCGFAYTTAAIYNDLPAATSIFNKPLIGAATYMNTLRDADKSSKINIGDNTISVSDYIKYAYVYQFSEDVMQQRLNTNFTSILIQGSENLYNSEGIFNLYNLVKNVTKDNNLGVIIWLNGFDVAGSVNPGCHSVLCVGVDEDSILIDDSNLRESNGYTDELGHLRINNDGTWIYEPYNGCYNSGNTCISYTMDYLKPYSILRTGNKVIADDYWIDDKNPGNSYIIGCEKLDNGKGLLYCDVTNYQLNDIQTTEILDIGSGEKSVENTGKLYWIDADATITITNIENAGKDAEFHRSAGNTIIDAIISDGSSITFGSDDSVNINSVIKEECMISYSYCSEDENYNSNVVQLTLTGTANGTGVTAIETDNGVQVTGLNNITVTYETADGTDTEDIEIENGETVNIVVNDEENSVDVEWNCSHLCHNDNAFMQFIWKIINFLSKIFGASQYCDCGMKHW